MQVCNVIRDRNEDVAEGRLFWPKEFCNKGEAFAQHELAVRALEQLPIALDFYHATYHSNLRTFVSYLLLYNLEMLSKKLK